MDWRGMLMRYKWQHQVRVSREDAKILRRNEGMTENDLSKLVVDLFFKIHKHYSPGLFESVYEEIFCYEWSKNGIPLKDNMAFH